MDAGPGLALQRTGGLALAMTMGQARPSPSGLGLEANERRGRTGSPVRKAAR
jgi:hypothetical protein